MKSLFLMINLFCLVSICFASESKVIEAPHFKDVLNHIAPNTLVILDIDDTLLIPVQTLGCDVWFRSRIDEHEKKGLCKAKALGSALAEWEAVRHLTKVKIVEEGSSDIIHEMQKKNIRVMGLTTQGIVLATRTFEQLLSLGIDLSKTAPTQEDVYFLNQRSVLFKHGILFTSGTQKGEALLKFLSLVNYHPEHIVFLNDKETHLKEVEQPVVAKNINFVGLRYSYSDERVNSFNKELADIQWKRSTFDRILSDEEAKKLLSTSY